MKYAEKYGKPKVSLYGIRIKRILVVHERKYIRTEARFSHIPVKIIR